MPTTMVTMDGNQMVDIARELLNACDEVWKRHNIRNTDAFGSMLLAVLGLARYYDQPFALVLQQLEASERWANENEVFTTPRPALDASA